MAPSISIRDSIRWLPSPATEPTRTVVLTSPEGRFVDIRILKPEGGAEVGLREDILPFFRLDWAFAGTSTSAPISSPTTDASGKVVHAKWTHWVDSRHVDAEAVSDEGDMFALQDGRTLEKGTMVNPETGLMGEYEEVWRDVRITGTEVVATTERDGSSRASGQPAGTALPPRPRCTVLTLSRDSDHARGMIVRLGQFCQGVLRIGEHFTLERWIWHASGGWKREVSIGDFFLPCGVACEDKCPSVGGRVEFGGFEWVVIEEGEV